MKFVVSLQIFFLMLINLSLLLNVNVKFVVVEKNFIQLKITFLAPLHSSSMSLAKVTLAPQITKELTVMDSRIIFSK